MELVISDRKQSQKILDAAFSCIAAKGYANVSLRDIAEEAGVVLSQLNYYYKNKEGLITEVMKLIARKYMQEIEDRLVIEQNRRDRFNELITYFQEILIKEPQQFKILFDLTGMALWSKELRELVNELYDGISNLIDKYIVSENDEEERREKLTSKSLSQLIMGTLIGASLQMDLSEGKKEVLTSLAAFEKLID